MNTCILFFTLIVSQNIHSEDASKLLDLPICKEAGFDKDDIMHIVENSRYFGACIESLKFEDEKIKEFIIKYDSKLDLIIKSKFFSLNHLEKYPNQLLLNSPEAELAFSFYLSLGRVLTLYTCLDLATGKYDSSILRFVGTCKYYRYTAKQSALLCIASQGAESKLRYLFSLSMHNLTRDNLMSLAQQYNNLSIPVTFSDYYTKIVQEESLAYFNKYQKITIRSILPVYKNTTDEEKRKIDAMIGLDKVSLEEIRSAILEYCTLCSSMSYSNNKSISHIIDNWDEDKIKNRILINYPRYICSDPRSTSTLFREYNISHELFRQIIIYNLGYLSSVDATLMSVRDDDIDLSSANGTYVFKYGRFSRNRDQIIYKIYIRK